MLLCAKYHKMTANLLYSLVITLSAFITATVLETGPFPHTFVHFQMSSWKPSASGCKSQGNLVAYSF